MAYRCKTILTATDFSPASRMAVRRAAELARQHQARLEVLHVLNDTTLAEAWQWLKEVAQFQPEQVRHKAAERLGEVVARIEQETGLKAGSSLVEGRAYRAIAAHAEAIGADLIVIGAQGEHALRDFFPGTTAQKVLRFAHQPVLVVKQTPPFSYERILMATDFSQASVTAARAARGLFPEALFYLFHAFEIPFERELMLAGADDAAFERYRRQAETELHQELERYAAQADFAPGEAMPKLRHGYPSGRIVSGARDLDVDLIVLGAQLRTGLEATLLGSVSLHVVMEAHCDVLLVKTPPA